jgi:Ca2+:H+ antiporter
MLKHFKPSMDWLLVFVPAALVLRFWPGLRHDVALFICSGLAIIPLAGIMGRATEHLSERMGEGIGGLLNASFGNAAELIIALMALHKGLVGVVKASITGSIMGISCSCSAPPSWPGAPNSPGKSSIAPRSKPRRPP